MADVSFPPASAKSGLPPPEPPTILASSWTILPAWSLGMRSFVTAVIRATLPSSAEAKTTTPEPSFWRRVSTIWRRASRSAFSTFAARTFTPLTSRTVVQKSLRLGAGGFALQAFQLLFQLLDLVDLALDGGDELVFRGVQQAGGAPQGGEGALVFGEGAVAGDGFDAADACGGGLLGDDLEDADFAGAVDVRAAAKFFRVEAAGRGRVGNGDDADVGLGVLVAEEGQRAGGEGVVDIHDVRGDLEIAQDFFVHLLLDFGELARVDGGEVREVEAQVVGRDERAGLLHVRAEDIAQRGVHQVRRGVVAHVARAAYGSATVATRSPTCKSSFATMRCATRPLTG